MFSGSMPWCSSMRLASDSRSVRRNWRYSQVWRVMFSRPYNYRRLAKDYEYLTRTSEAMIRVVMIQLIVRRLARMTLF
jgi:hypothetical protein